MSYSLPNIGSIIQALRTFSDQRNQHWGLLPLDLMVLASRSGTWREKSVKKSLIFAFIIYVSSCLFLGGSSLPEVVFHHLEIFPDISFVEKCLERSEKALGIWQVKNLLWEGDSAFVFVLLPCISCLAELTGKNHLFLLFPCFLLFGLVFWGVFLHHNKVSKWQKMRVVYKITKHIK